MFILHTIRIYAYVSRLTLLCNILSLLPMPRRYKKPRARRGSFSAVDDHSIRLRMEQENMDQHDQLPADIPPVTVLKNRDAGPPQPGMNEEMDGVEVIDVEDDTEGDGDEEDVDDSDSSDSDSSESEDDEACDDKEYEMTQNEPPLPPFFVPQEKAIDQDADLEQLDDFFVFDSQVHKALFHNLNVMMIGDSLMRALYKDFVSFLDDERLLTAQELKANNENSFRGDGLVDCSPLDKDRVFRQAREYQTDTHLVQFMFSARVFKDDVDRVLAQMFVNDEYPDVLLLNSVLWDLTRYFEPTQLQPYEKSERAKGASDEAEKQGMNEYLSRAAMLVRRLQAILPASTLVVYVIWPWCVPPKAHSNSFLRRGHQQHQNNKMIRSLVMDGNFRIAQIFRECGFDVLDIGYLMRNHALTTHRIDDGVHWDAAATRLMLNFVIMHIMLAWRIPVPEDIKDKMDEWMEELELDDEQSEGSRALNVFSCLNSQVSNPHTKDPCKVPFGELRAQQFRVQIRDKLMAQILKEEPGQSTLSHRRSAFNRIEKDICRMRMALWIIKGVRLEDESHIHERARLLVQLTDPPALAEFYGVEGAGVAEYTVGGDREAMLAEWEAGEETRELVEMNDEDVEKERKKEEERREQERKKRDEDRQRRDEQRQREWEEEEEGEDEMERDEHSPELGD